MSRRADIGKCDQPSSAPCSARLILNEKHIHNSEFTTPTNTTHQKHGMIQSHKAYQKRCADVLQGKRKAAKKPQGKKKREGLATTFACVFCNTENGVSVKIDKKSGVGTLNCKMCGQTFQNGVDFLTAPVDVYFAWVDACDAVAQETANAAPAASQPSYRQSQTSAYTRPAVAPGDKPTAEDDGFIDDDDADAEVDYEADD